MAAKPDYSCGGCGFWRRTITQGIGTCHGRAPVPLMIGIGRSPEDTPVPIVHTYWPQTPSVEFCGDFQARAGASNLAPLDKALTELAQAVPEGEG